MAVTYTPTTHTAPVTATVTSSPTSIEGLSPGQVCMALSDGRAPTSVFLPTLISADGYPTQMTPYTTGTGTVA